MLLSSLRPGLYKVPVLYRLGCLRAARDLFDSRYGAARKHMDVPMMAQFRVLGIRSVSHSTFHPIHWLNFASQILYVEYRL